MITNGFTYMAVLLFMAGVLVTLEKTAKGGLAKFFRYVPSMVLCYLIAMLLCTLKVWDLAETKAAYGALKNNLTYAMIFAMLLRCDMIKILRCAQDDIFAPSCHSERSEDSARIEPQQRNY